MSDDGRPRKRRKIATTSPSTPLPTPAPSHSPLTTTPSSPPEPDTSPDSSTVGLWSRTSLTDLREFRVCVCRNIMPLVYSRLTGTTPQNRRPRLGRNYYRSEVPIEAVLPPDETVHCAPPGLVAFPRYHNERLPRKLLWRFEALSDSSRIYTLLQLSRQQLVHALQTMTVTFLASLVRLYLTDDEAREGLDSYRAAVRKAPARRGRRLFQVQIPRKYWLALQVATFFVGKGVAEVSRKEEALLLEEWREENRPVVPLFFEVVGVTLPRDLLLQIVSFLEPASCLLSVGLVSWGWYAAVLSSWKRLTINYANVWWMSLLAYSSASRISVPDLLSREEWKFVVDRIHPSRLKTLSMHVQNLAVFVDVLKSSPEQMYPNVWHLGMSGHFKGAEAEQSIEENLRVVARAFPNVVSVSSKAFPSSSFAIFPNLDRLVCCLLPKELVSLRNRFAGRLRGISLSVRKDSWPNPPEELPTDWMQQLAELARSDGFETLILNGEMPLLSDRFWGVASLKNVVRLELHKVDGSMDLGRVSTLRFLSLGCHQRDFPRIVRNVLDRAHEALELMELKFVITYDDSIGLGWGYPRIAPAPVFPSHPPLHIELCSCCFSSERFRLLRIEYTAGTSYGRRGLKLYRFPSLDVRRLGTLYCVHVRSDGGFIESCTGSLKTFFLSLLDDEVVNIHRSDGSIPVRIRELVVEEPTVLKTSIAAVKAFAQKRHFVEVRDEGESRSRWDVKGHFLIRLRRD